MRFEKHILGDLDCCYTMCQISLNGEEYYVYAPDDKGPCYGFHAETGKKEIIWEDYGGTMSLIPLHGKNGDFLASQMFLPGFKALDTRIVKMIYKENEWIIEPWMSLPYVHRFDILKRNGNYYFLGCILSSTDYTTADWSSPGTLVVSLLDDNFSAPNNLEQIAGGMHHNHGYSKFERDGYDCALTASDQGVFEVTPPEMPSENWEVEKILDRPASDAVYCDIDGDGIDELAVIEPFHGTELVIYKKYEGKFKEMYRHSEEMDFLHALWGGVIAGESVIICGYRELGRKLFMLKWNGNSIQSEVIEEGYGPSNVSVVEYKDRQRLLVANREFGQAAYFDIYKE